MDRRPEIMKTETFYKFNLFTHRDKRYNKIYFASEIPSVVLNGLENNHGNMWTRKTITTKEMTQLLKK